MLTEQQLELRARLYDELSAIRAPNAASTSDLRAHLDNLTKPPGSLGVLEDVAVKLGTIYGDPPPPLTRRLVIVLAADHGVAARGVSAYPQEVTRQMCNTCAEGNAAINVIARACQADVLLVDVGVLGQPCANVRTQRVREGSRDFTIEAALTEEEALNAVLMGIDLVREHASNVDIFALGEMGIGNTTSAAALTAALTGGSADQVVGSGTGISSAALEHKRIIVRDAVARLKRNDDCLTVLAAIGGIEIAALAGVVLGAAEAQRPVVTDGFISTAAVLVASRLAPEALHYVFASHRSCEPGHSIQLDTLGLEPLLALRLRLGEGTGAALALPVIEAAGALLREMATFESAGVSGKNRDE